jgi:septum formation protein
MILESHGIDCLVVAPVVDEGSLSAAWQASGSTDVAALVKALADAKASAASECAEWHSTRAMPEPRLLIAADTVVYNGRVLGKPASDEEALDMLMELAGRTHEVHTGVALLDLQDGTRRLLSDCTRVTFKPYGAALARQYVQSGEPFDKAGAYAIQGTWGAQAAKIEGDYECVVGLPWHLVAPFILKQ